MAFYDVCKFATLMLVGNLMWQSCSAQSRTFSLGSRQYELVAGESGCAIYQPAEQVLNAKQAAAFGFKYRRTWQGACVNGLAEGLGQFSETTEWPKATSVFSGPQESIGRSVKKHTVRMRGGVPVGYSKLEFSNTDLPSRVEWHYQYGSDKVIINGLGLYGEDALVTNETVLAPIARQTMLNDESTSSDASRVVAGLVGLSGQLEVRVQTCAAWFLKNQFQECGYEAGKKKFSVYYLLKGDESNKEILPDIKLCPNPKSLNGCAAVAHPAAEGLRIEIRDFIEATRSAVEADIKKSNEVLRQSR